MNNIWRVALHEFRRNVFKRSFLVSVLSVPFFIALSTAMGLILESFRGSSGSIGIVDHAGLIGEAVLPAGIRPRLEAGYDDPAAFTKYPDEEAALAAVNAGELQAFFILPADYRQSRRVEMVYAKEPSGTAWRQFYDLLQAAQLEAGDSDAAFRLVSGSGFMVRSIDGRREVPAGSGPTFALLMPMFISFAFLLMVVLGSGYAMSAITDEKENRTIEVLITSIPPQQLIAGKILGVAAISFVLLASWGVVVWAGLHAARLAGIGWFGDLSLDWNSVLACLAVAVPSYVLATALMTAVGATVPSTQEGQSYGIVFGGLHLLPVYLSILLLRDPHSPTAVLLSLLPFTSLMTISFRLLLTTVPVWQVAAAAALQVLYAACAVWFAGRIYRLGLLHFGRRLDLRGWFLRRGGP